MRGEASPSGPNPSGWVLRVRAGACQLALVRIRRVAHRLDRVVMHLEAERDTLVEGSLRTRVERIVGTLNSTPASTTKLNLSPSLHHTPPSHPAPTPRAALHPDPPPHPSAAETSEGYLLAFLLADLRLESGVDVGGFLRVEHALLMVERGLDHAIADGLRLGGSGRRERRVGGVGRDGGGTGWERRAHRPAAVGGAVGMGEGQGGEGGEGAGGSSETHGDRLHVLGVIEGKLGRDVLEVDA